LGGSFGPRRRGGAPESTYDSRLRRKGEAPLAAQQGESGSAGWGHRIQYSCTYPPREADEDAQMGPDASHRLGSGAGHRGPHTGGNGHLAVDHLVGRASLVAATDATLPLALADRVVFQATEVVAAFRCSAFPPGTHRQILDAGAIPGGCLGSEVSATGRSTFPLGVRT